MPMRSRARRLIAAILATGVLATASVSPALAVGVIGDGTDDKVTGVTCVRHDGGTDQSHDNTPPRPPLRYASPNLRIQQNPRRQAARPSASTLRRLCCGAISTSVIFCSFLESWMTHG